MMKITAKGKFNGQDMEIIAEKKKNDKVEFLFDGKKDKTSEQYLVNLLSNQYSFGNYVPEIYEDLNIYNVLENHFGFDDKPKIDAQGMKTLPYEKGVIY